MLKAFVSVQNLITRLHRDDRGATAVEYGLIVALIAAVVVTAAGLLGKQIEAVFTNVTGGMTLP
jgi:pilus assembly protein Flp/PilA